MSTASADEITVSEVGLAGLLPSVSGCTRVQEERSEAVEPLDQVLAEIRKPIRALRERWSRSDKLQLATIVITLVAILMPSLRTTKPS